MKNQEGQDTETISLTVPSHPRFLYVIRSAVYPVLTGAGFSRRETRRIILALDEACSNIIKHAYGGDPSCTIFLHMTVGPDEARFELRDTGKQADDSAIGPRDLADIRPGGLGTHFMNSAFDSVHYEKTGQAGTLLTLIKKRV